jgi:hypothetical protein
VAENDNNLKELQRLRTFLNPAIKGKVTNAILESLATGSGYMVDQIEAVNEQLYIATASGQYLDQRLADYNLTRPAAVGLSDDVFREIGINVINSKQIRYLIEQLLLAMFGEEAANSTSSSTEFEPYNLDDGDMLIVGFDGQPSSTVIFNSSQFTNISSASALEVADAITRGLRSQGKSGSAFAKDDGAGGYVVLLSDTTGPSSSVTVLGGRAQNILKFEAIRPTTAGPSTTWTVSQISGGSLRYTWTAGANPSIGKVRENDYVNIYGTSFNTANQGTYTVTTVKSGTVGNAYFELDNPNGIVEVVVQGTVDSILFFNPFVSNMSTKQRFAAAYQTQTNILNIFIPATTKVVRRSRVGSAHLHELNLPSTPDTYGPYVYDLSQPFVISSAAGTTASTALDSDSGRVISVTDSSQFPDSPGNIILGYGTSHQEGPIPYLARPSNTSLLLNPSYTIINNHPIGTDVALISQLGPVVIAKDGSDYPFFVTDIVSGRTYAEDLINAIVATGITTVITIVYPGDIGLGKWGTQYSEKTYIWGPDPQ